MVDLPMMGRAGMSQADYFPPAPQQQGAFGSLGGLGRGVANFANSPGGNDLLQSMFMSMMTSPSNAPLAAMPEIMGGLQQQRFQQQKYDEALKEQERKQLEAQQEREALVVAAKSAGLSEEEARSLAINPTALKMRLDQVQTERANNERNQFMQGLPSLYGEPAQPAQQPANEVSQDSWGALAQEYGWAVPGGEPDTFQMAQTQPQAQPVQPASRNAENLMRMREQEIHRLYAAPDERTRKVIEGRIGQIDKRLELEGQTDSQKNLDYRAREAGLVRGTPEYQNFMLTGGAGGTSLMVGPDGTVQFSQGHTKPLTEGQSKDATYATRAEGSLGTLDQFGASLTSPIERAAEYDPTGMLRGQQSAEFQQAKQAGDEFLQAILRKDTGAAITKDEMEGYGRTYLPMPGDGPEVLAQKQVARRRALEALKAGMPPQAILNQEEALRRSGAGDTPPPSAVRPRAVNPSTGQAIEFDGSRWVPVQ